LLSILRRDERGGETAGAAVPPERKEVTSCFTGERQAAGDDRRAVGRFGTADNAQMTTAPGITIRALERRLPAIGFAYLVVFLLLDWVSYIRPFQGLNITPWNPQPALAIALLLASPRWWWLVWGGLVAAELAVRGWPSDWIVALLATAALALSYAAIARAAQVRLDRSLALATRRDLLWFTAISVGGALLSATVYVGTYAAAGHGPSGPLVEAIARYWIGDAVGLVVMLPMLLVLMDPHRRSALVSTVRGREWWLVAALIAALVLLIFGFENNDQFKYFYLLFLPTVWASARLGLAGAVLSAALTQIGLIIAVQSIPHPDLTVFELQVLMAAMTMTGLVLGVAVDERERAAAELKGSLRLAAAGQMAAALAHELSQPLTALNSYAEASRLILAADLPDGERLTRLADVSARMADDALRASEVVKRLREFFRTGSTQLQAVLPAELLTEVVAASRRRADAVGVLIRSELDPGLPALLLDPVQIGVVLRNLMANALDAASVSGGPGRVSVRARAQKDALRIEIEDSGGGVDTARLQSLFEAGPSDKPGGMGLGLSICRAIVEAHGGTLWAEPGPHGRVCVTRPGDRPPRPGAAAAA
jgi:signal transduction histidine kinase